MITHHGLGPENAPTKAEAEEDYIPPSVLHPAQFGKAPGHDTVYAPLYKPGEEPF
jgi:hypothetical protein